MMGNILKQEKWRFIDQTNMGLDLHALYSFGMDDCLCASVGSGLSPATARTWVHKDTVVLGIQDTNLPFIKDGLDFLKGQGYQYIVRNSGGLAVVLDEGVLNLSLIFPEKGGRIDIDKGYEAMYSFVKEMFHDEEKEIVAKEIVGSYCPGSYDLSIDGKKFAGISQRRIRHGVAVQIYLCVTGKGSERAKIIQQFYAISKRDVETKFPYPVIRPEVMASLSELLHKDLTIHEVLRRVLTTLKGKSGQLFSNSLTVEEQPLFHYYYDRIVDRNEKFLLELK